jgi:hypothetical protein
LKSPVLPRPRWPHRSVTPINKEIRIHHPPLWKTFLVFLRRHVLLQMSYYMLVWRKRAVHRLI